MQKVEASSRCSGEGDQNDLAHSFSPVSVIEFIVYPLFVSTPAWVWSMKRIMHIRVCVAPFILPSPRVHPFFLFFFYKGSVKGKQKQITLLLFVLGIL